MDGMYSKASGIKYEFKQLADLIGGELSRVWDDLFAGKISSFADLWDRMLGSVVTSFQKAMADMTDVYVKVFLKAILGTSTLESMGKTIAGSIGNIIGGGITYSGSGGLSNSYDGGHLRTNPTVTLPNSFNTHHTRMAGGGVIPEHVFGVGKSGSTYEFGENGPEKVLSTADSFGGGAPANVSINIVNSSKAQVQQTSKPRFDGKQMIIDVLLEDYAAGGRTRQIMGGR